MAANRPNDAGRLHQEMIDRARARGSLRSTEVESAFRAVPRHLFLPGADLERVYSGSVVVTRTDERGQAISSSSEIAIMAPMLEDLHLRPGQRVLEIGTGTGYNAALLDHLVGSSGEVVSVELDEAIAAEARAHLGSAGRDRVRVVVADGRSGHAERAPYDRIIATASVSDMPRAWVDQLADGGRLTVPLRLRANAPLVVTFEKVGETLRSVALIPGGFMPLRGEPESQEPVVTIEDQWQAAISSPETDDASTLRELLRGAPSIETLPDVPWQVAWLVGLNEAEWITVRQSGSNVTWSGLYDRAARSLALMSFIGVPMRMGVRVALVYGGAAAHDRLLGLIQAVKDVDIRDLRLEVVPASRPAAPGELTIAGANFRYALRRATV